MLCVEFEDRLTDYLEGALAPDENRAFAEHAMRCPVCHDLLSEVKTTVRACNLSEIAPPPQDLEARIILKTMPELEMTCKDFENHLTDYLDGFLPAPLYHRWERHAALCHECAELPGLVVRTIGACYTYINEQQPVPFGLHERILEATLGTVRAEEKRAPWPARLASRIRLFLDPIISPQLATVATMLLVAVLVMTSTVSADGSISGMYRASLKLAEQTYAQGAQKGTRGGTLSEDIKQIGEGITSWMGARSGGEQQQPQQNNQQPEHKQEQQKR